MAIRGIGVLAVGLLLPALIFSQQPRSLADRAYKAEVLQKVAGLVETKYVLADKAEGFADEFRAKCASGAYDALNEAKEFAAKITADLVAITGDKHLNFRLIESSGVGEIPVSPLHHPVRYRLLGQAENTGFHELEWIEPKIGYLDIRRFNHFGEAKEMALAAMAFLSGADAVIIDVRENGGGSGDYLSSYFLPFPTQLSGSYSRVDDTLTEFWTRRDIGMEPRTDVPLIVLIGPRTFSAAESFAYDLQSRKRATLVGEPTKGGAHSVDLFRVGDQFEFTISTERAVSPVTGGNWEGTGVLPDVPVSAANALERAITMAKKAGEEFGRAKEARLKTAVGEMQGDLDRAEKAGRENRIAEMESALDALFKTADAAGLVTEFFIDVFAYEYRSEAKNPMLLAIFKKGVEFFPDSSDAHARLASVYQSRGEKELALRHFEKALALNPGNRNAAKMVEALKK